MNHPVFDRVKCQPKRVWCGKGDMPLGYLRDGTRHECLQQGFGAGSYTEKAKRLPYNSLQRIKYVGEIHEKSFRGVGIYTLEDLKKWTSKNSTTINAMLRKVLRKSNEALDVRAYNHVLLWLDENGAKKLPSCVAE